MEPAVALPDAAALVHDHVLSLLLPDKPGLVLDVPAGEGAFAARVRESGIDVRCGDLDVARFKVPGIQCRQVDLNKPWPYPNEMFDCVVSIEAVEHLENPWHLVREAGRVLRPGGRLLVTTPNVLSIRSRLSYLLYGYPNYFHYMVDRDPGTDAERPVDHINPVGFLELRHVLARNGFRVEHVSTNRFVKPRSLTSRLIRFLVRMRGRTHGRKDPAKAEVRHMLLSDPLLFGEILIVKAVKATGR